MGMGRVNAGQQAALLLAAVAALPAAERKEYGLEPMPAPPSMSGWAKGPKVRLRTGQAAGQTAKAIDRRRKKRTQERASRKRNR